MRILLLWMLATFFAAQAGLPPMAGISDGQLVIYNGSAQTIAPVNNLFAMSWGGDTLAYSTLDSSGALTLYVTDGGAPRLIAEGVSYLPPTFDGSTVIYGREGHAIRETERGPSLPVQLYRHRGEPELIGAIEFGVGCGGGSPFPMDGVYNIEAGFGGRALMLEYTDHGIVYSLNCAGVGLGLLDLATGEAQILSETISRATINGSQIVGINEAGGLLVIDLSSGDQRSISTSQQADQLTADGQTVYYSTRTLGSDPLPLSAEEAEALARTMGMGADSVPQYQVAIYRLNLSSGAETQVYTEHAWAVGRLFMAEGALYFSLIPNGEGWVEVLATGAIDLSSPESFLQARASAQPTIMRFSGGEATEVASGIYQATPRP